MIAANRRSAEVRQERARLKRALADGEPLGKLLLAPPAAALSMEIRVLIRACPYYGRVRMNELCRRARVLPTQTLAELTCDERWRLWSGLSEAHRK